MLTVTRAARAIAVGMMMLASTGAAFADSFGAIAISPGTGATGWAHDYSSRYDAEQEAQSNCDGYAGDCQVAIWFKNACGAVARGPDGWGSGWGNRRRRAEQEALNSCSRHSYDCEIIRWQCSGAR